MAAPSSRSANRDFIELPNLGLVSRADLIAALEHWYEPQVASSAPLASSALITSKASVQSTPAETTSDTVGAPIALIEQAAGLNKESSLVKGEPIEQAQVHSVPVIEEHAPLSNIPDSEQGVSSTPAPPPAVSSTALPTLRTRWPAKPKASADDLVLPAAILPKNSAIMLVHQKREDAIRTVTDAALRWYSPRPDPSIPTFDEERQAYVLRLLLAFMNCEDLQNMGHGRGKRWTDVEGHYTKDAMEKVCWDIVHIAERLHTEGPSFLSIHDPHMQREIRQDSTLTFEERMQYLIKLLCFYKSKCEDFMKGTQAEEIVACPKQKLQSCRVNLMQNKGRAVVIRKGREAKKAAEAAEAEQDDMEALAQSTHVDGGDTQVAVDDRAATTAEVDGPDGDVSMKDNDEVPLVNDVGVPCSIKSNVSTLNSKPPSLALRTLKRGHTGVPVNDDIADTTEPEPKRIHVK